MKKFLHFIKRLLLPKNVVLADEVKQMLIKFDKDHYNSTGNLCGYLTGIEQYELFGKLINPNDVPVMYTGNWENAAFEEYAHLIMQIKKHPFLWKFFQL